MQTDSTAPVTSHSPRNGRRAGTILLLASLAMVATLPGRTVGLGLITEQLLVDLALSRSHYAELNLWATRFLYGNDARVGIQILHVKSEFSLNV